MTEFDYVGSELELFRDAKNWKSYFSRKLQPYISGQVLEVGAGIGGTTEWMCTGNEESWECLEPDSEMSEQITARQERGELPDCVRSVNGVLADIEQKLYDTILYIDVLEHIEDDQGELELAAARLKHGGKLVVLSPAYNMLFTDFDKAVGHYRRYNHEMLSRIAPSGLIERRAFYLDSVGMFASLANRLMLRQSMPTKSQIGVWDKLMVPISRVTDLIFSRLFGRSIIVVWERGT